MLKAGNVNANTTDKLLKMTEYQDLVFTYKPTKKLDILDEWRSIIGNTAQPFLITILGDAFLQEKDGTIFLLESNLGRYSKIAVSKKEFELIFEEYLEKLAPKTFVQKLLKSKESLPANSCFSLDIPFFLGGEFSIENFNVCDFYTHFSMQGQLYKSSQKVAKEMNAKPAAKEKRYIY